MNVRRHMRHTRENLRLFQAIVYAGFTFVLAQQIGSYYLAHKIYSGSESYWDSRSSLVSFPQFLFQNQDLELQDAANWIKNHAQRNDIITTAMPQWVYLRTRLKSVMP